MSGGPKLGVTGLSVFDEKLWGFYRATVLDVADPLQLGRIKAEVIPYFVGIDKAILPWAVPKNPMVEGAGIGIGTFAVPSIGTLVWVFFEMGDVYQPVYDGGASDAIHGLPTFRTTNYPNTRGFRTSSGVEFYINDTTKTITLNHPTGTSVVIDTAGDVTINSVNDVKATGNAAIDLSSAADAIIRGSELSIGAPIDVVPLGSTSEVRRIWVVTSVSNNQITLQERRLGLSIPPAPQTRTITVT